MRHVYSKPEATNLEVLLVELPFTVITVGEIGQVHITLDGADFPATITAERVSVCSFIPVT